MMKFILLSALITASFSPLFGQIDIEYLGLSGQQLTCLDINYSIVAVGTDRKGVQWQFESIATETGWAHIGMDSSVQTVYPHKSGPIGWAITVGIAPANGEAPFVYCSTGGADFHESSDGLTSDMTSAIWDLDGFPDPFVCGETYAAGDRALYRRYFGDTIWHPVFSATIEGYIQTVKVHQEFPGLVLLGGADGFAGRLLARSTDFGGTWEDISAPGAVRSIDFSGATADTIFVTVSDRIYRSLDGGANWLAVFDEGLQIQLTKILYDRASQIVYAAGGSVPGDEALLLMSDDFGESWQIIPLENKGTILGLESGSDGWVYFITRNEGVFRFRNATSDVEDFGSYAKSAITLGQNYPNPFSGSTQIDYEIGTPSQVIISILNTAGIEVETLLNERKPAGKYSLTWDASDFQDGIYLVVLSAMQQSVAKEMVIVNR
jgi:hypothetical protein